MLLQKRGEERTPSLLRVRVRARGRREGKQAKVYVGLFSVFEVPSTAKNRPEESKKVRCGTF